MTATDTTPMTLDQFDALVQAKGGIDKLNKGEAVAYLKARLEANPSSQAEADMEIPVEIKEMLNNLVSNLGTTTNVSLLGDMSPEDVEVFAHAVSQGFKGTKEEFLTELKLSTNILEARTSTELWSFAVDIRKAAVAKMKWGEYTKYLAVTYGPAVATGVAAALAAQYGVSWWQSNQESAIDLDVIENV
jgi:hypothetical protein